MGDEGKPDTLAEWLRWRFGGTRTFGVPFHESDEADQSYWEREAAAVRRAVERGGFKQREGQS